MTFSKILVLGAGAVGSVVGALLSRRNDVTLIGNPAHVEAVNSDGLSMSGDVDQTFRLKADTQVREIPEGTLIFLTTKAYDSEEAAKGILGLLRKDTVILVLQNGLGNEEVVKSVVRDRARVLRGVTSMAAEFFKAGQVWYWKGEIIVEKDPWAKYIADAMNACGLKTSVSGNIREKVWVKTAVNSVINPLTAILRVRNREIGAPSLAGVRHQIVRECVQVGHAEAVELPRGLEEDIDREIVSYSNFSSMYQDMMKKRKTEIDFLNGKIVELARKHRVSAPVNETLVHLIKFMEEKNELSRGN